MGIDTEALDAGGHTAWSCFIYTLEVDEFDIIGYLRIPNDIDTAAFVELFLDIRNRKLEEDAAHLAPIAEALQNRQAEEACELLSSLTQQKERAGRRADVETLRTIRLQVQEDMWEAAVEAVEEKIQVLREDIAKSPWDVESWYDGPKTLHYVRAYESGAWPFVGDYNRDWSEGDDNSDWSEGDDSSDCDDGDDDSDGGEGDERGEGVGNEADNQW